MNAYILVIMGKERQKESSDRGFALKNGLTTQNIVDWKAGKSLPNWENMEKLARAADIELWEAVKIMKENEVILKQAGFADVQLLMGIMGLSLAAVGAISQSPVLWGSALALNGGIYIMRN